MAKKAKKAAKKAKRVVNPRTLEGILVECAIEVGRGVGGSVTVSEDALKYWRTTFRATIKRALSQGESWKKAKGTVLLLARIMGSLSAAKANPITKTAAKDAADAVRKDPRCPRGRGKFC
jgi:hypothetical protein